MTRPTPFTIYIDTAEQLPFRFLNIRGDSDTNYEVWDVKTEPRCLGRHPNSLGDYSISDGLGKCHIERKSKADMQNTLLGFADGHRARFECELNNLAMIEAPLVIVECSFADFVCNPPEYGSKDRAEVAKILFRSSIALQQETRVPWIFAEDKLTAEYSAFCWLKRWFDKHQQQKRREAKEAKKEKGG